MVTRDRNNNDWGFMNHRRFRWFILKRRWMLDLADKTLTVLNSLFGNSGLGDLFSLDLNRLQRVPQHASDYREVIFDSGESLLI